MKKFKKIVKYTGISILVALTIIGIFILLIKNSTLLNPEATNIESQQIMIFGFSLDTIGLCLTIIGVPGTAIWGAFQYSKNKSENFRFLILYYLEILIAKMKLI